MGKRVINNTVGEAVDERSGSEALAGLCRRISEGRYILLLGADIVLKPEYGGGNSRKYIEDTYSEMCDEVRTRTAVDTYKWKIGRYLQKDWIYDESEMTDDLVALLSTKFFPIVLTTTYDGYIESILRKIYGEELRIGNIYGANPDIEAPDPEYDTMSPTLYYVFGKAEEDVYSDFVYSADDRIKVIERWLTDRTAPNLQGYLRNKNLLAIGCRFEDWFFRFFWYCLCHKFKASKESCVEQVEGEVAISLTDGDDLTKYLESIRVYNRGNARTFLHQLAGMLGDPTRYIPLREKGVFISYASEDFREVYKIYAVLERAGVPVWFDRKKLRGGDRYDERIEQAIRRCRIFMPVLSEQTRIDLEKGNERYYKDTEWTLIDRNPECRIVPVVLPGFDIATGRELLPPTWQKLSIVKWSKNEEENILEAIQK